MEEDCRLPVRQKIKKCWLSRRERRELRVKEEKSSEVRLSSPRSYKQGKRQETLFISSHLIPKKEDQIIEAGKKLPTWAGHLPPRKSKNATPNI